MKNLLGGRNFEENIIWVSHRKIISKKGDWISIGALLG
jgi:hypothetical protein